MREGDAALRFAAGRLLTRQPNSDAFARVLRWSTTGESELLFNCRDNNQERVSSRLAERDPVRGVACVMMVQRATFPNSDSSVVRGAFQQAAAKALGKQAAHFLGLVP